MSSLKPNAASRSFALPGNARMRKDENSATFCRRMEWVAGTVLAGDEGYGETVITLTAIGEDGVLARALVHAGSPTNGRESLWALGFRDWREITDPAGYSPELATAVTHLRSRAPLIHMEA